MLQCYTYDSHISIRNIEQYDVTGTDGNDLLFYAGGTRYIGGKGTDTFYWDLSAVNESIVWDNDPSKTTTVQGVELSGLERLLITTGSGDDVIKNTLVTTDDYIDTGAGNDTIDSGSGKDTIYAGSGDDNIHIEGGAGGVIDAGSGNDTISISSYVGGYYTIDGGDGFESIDIDLTGFSYGFRWRYSSYFYELYSGSSYSTIHDVLISGIDKLQCYTDYYGSGYSGISIKNIEQYDITGTDGSDLLFYSGGTRYIGGKGTDAFYWDLSAVTDAIIWDNNPEDTITLQGVTLAGLERLLITTGSGDDFIRNTRVITHEYNGDYIATGSGNDTVYSGSESDMISTAEGNDVIDSGSGNDTIYAGSGDDQIHIDGGTGGFIDAGSGNDTISISHYVSGYYTIDGGDGFESIDIDLTGFSYGFRWRYSSYFYELYSGSSYSTIHDVLISGIDKLQCYTDYYGSGYSGISIKNIEQYDITGTDGSDLLLYAGGTRYIGGKGTDAFYWDLSAVTDAIIWDNNPDDTITLQGVTLAGLERLLITTGSGDDFIRNTRVITHGYGGDYIDAGTGNDTVYSGSGSDVISTAEGNDVIDSGSGNDTIYAGSGDDQIHIDGGTGGFIDAGSGNDTISISHYVSGYYTIDGGDGFESIDIDLTGFSYGFRWRYSSYFYELYSGSSYSTIHDVLISGIDKLQCYTDYYGSGYSGISIKNIEQYDITGTDGSDLLLYAGGTRYIGGKGTDTFYWDLSAVTEAIVWNNDPSKTTMVQGVELSGLERLLIVTGSGDDVIKNTLVTTDDYIDTGAGNDTIDGGGGSDTMIGGLGNDFYAVDSSGDVVTEFDSEGIDTVQSTISYALGANLENLILAGVSAINGTGNAAANTLVGNIGNNSISGGEGNDTIYGGEGSDTAIFTGQFVDYVIEYNAGMSAYTVVDTIANRDGTDVISSVENFQFADGTKIMTSSIVDVVAPTASSFTPPDGIDSVAIGSNIVLVFSEAIKSGVGTIAIHSDSASGPVVESYDTATSANLTISGATLTINPTSDLANDTHYFITLDAESVKDIAGNSYAGTDTYDFTTASAASLHDLNGATTFWKTGLPITTVTSTLASLPAVAGTQPIEFRNIQTAADGTRTLEIWETSPTAAINSVLLDLALPTGSTATWQDATDLPSGWNSSPNTDKPGQFLLGGIGTTALSSGSVKLGTLTLTAPTNPQHFELSLMTGQLGNDTIPAFALSSDSMTTGNDGLYQHLAMNDGTYTLTSAKVSGTAESNAIKANDALAALKIAVGMNPNTDGSAVSPYQYLAADVNKDGQVKAADALNILKMAVKLSTAPEMEWLFVPESVGNESMSRTHVVWPDNPIPVTLDMDLDVNLIGIVKGDVDGSWAA